MSSSDAAARRFTNSFDSVLVFCTVATLLGGLNAIVNRRAAGAIARAVHHLLLIGFRVACHALPDQQRAHKIFAWGCCIITVVLAVILGAAQYHGPYASGVSTTGAWFTFFMFFITSLYLRHMCVTAAPRLLILIAVAMATAISTSRHPFSELGHPDEGVLTTAFLLLGELVGHTLEVGWSANIDNSTAGKASPGVGSTSGRLNEADFDSTLNGGGRSEEEEEEKAVLSNEFNVLGLIGRGSWADVFLVSRGGSGVDAGRYFAMKRVSKSHLKPKQLSMVHGEASILKQVQEHPFIVSLYTALQSERFVYLALTYAGGGDLTRWFDDLTPERSRLVLSEVLLALIHLHSNQIIYRDLKPENTLVGLDGHVLLGDFGASKRLHLDDGSNAPAERIATGTLVGTPNYMAPEQWGHKLPQYDSDGGSGSFGGGSGESCSGGETACDGYSYEVDLWAMGVMLHEMLTGSTVGDPRRGAFPRLRLQEIGDENARDLIGRTLVRQPVKRLGFGEGGAITVKGHEYFHGIDFEGLLRKEVEGPLMLSESTLPRQIGKSL